MRSYKEYEDEQSPLNGGNNVSARQSPISVHKSDNRSKGYGVKFISDKTIHSRYRQRRKMADKRLRICDWSVFLALVGLVLAIIDVELLVGLGHLEEVI